jgi:hypothetical protein
MTLVKRSNAEYVIANPKAGGRMFRWRGSAKIRGKTGDFLMNIGELHHDRVSGTKHDFRNNAMRFL